MFCVIKRDSRYRCSLIHIHSVANDIIKEDPDEYLGVDYAKNTTAEEK